MTRWAMVADLRRCVGCQTCTAACKHANATPPGVQWRRVLDVETGEFPDVQRAFIPIGCQHCDEPACLPVCPTTATRKRADGIVTIDYDLCIGCAYCTMACPYQARSKSPAGVFAYGNTPTANEERRDEPSQRSVATKCTFCVDRIDQGLEKGLLPGRDAEATPACVNACIAEALAFGDIEDPDSNVSQLLARNEHFRLNEELGTGPGFYYLWDRKRP
jgi:phenylacetyl-CoA:acceptor oxidoreductase 27-kDa subunit